MWYTLEDLVEHASTRLSARDLDFAVQSQGGKAGLDVYEEISFLLSHGMHSIEVMLLISHRDTIAEHLAESPMHGFDVRDAIVDFTKGRCLPNGVASSLQI